jgi:hypothetical protein
MIMMMTIIRIRTRASVMMNFNVYEDVFVYAGGSIGEVSVTWMVKNESLTATYGTDYLADGATLTFAAGQTRQSKVFACQGSKVIFGTSPAYDFFRMNLNEKSVMKVSLDLI